VDLAAASHDGDRTGHVASVDVTTDRLPYPGEALRREASGCQSLLLISTVLLVPAQVPSAEGLL
jgi:hypothetical protein